MLKKVLEKNRARLASEKGTTLRRWSNRQFRVALVYPNSYANGMSNLGYQTVYNLINQRDDCLCERFFMPDRDDLDDCLAHGQELLSLESERRLCDFDLIALSISFENDYLNLPHFFSLCDIPLYREQRGCDYPLVLFGGVCAFLNPEPLADIVDIAAIGEAEVILPDMLDYLASCDVDRKRILADLVAFPGLYLPGFYRAQYDDSGLFSGLIPSGQQPVTIRRQFVRNLSDSASRNFVKATDTEFSDMALTEISRGCARGCRFCAAGFIYLPVRERSVDVLVNQIDEGLCGADRVGLVAAAAADYSKIEDLQQHLLDAGLKISMASLRLDALAERDVERLVKADHRTVAIAPEAGSQRMRDLINKQIDKEQILRAVHLLADGGIENLKLYFIIGLPSEQQDDVEEIVSLADEISDIWRTAGKQRGRMGQVILSINPFIPKPFTPLQWAGMDAEKSLKKKYRYLQSAISRRPNMRINCESIRQARIQAFLSRGDRRIAQLLPELAAGKNLRHVGRAYDIDTERFITANYDESALFPWEIIDQGLRRSYLWSEYQRALAVCCDCGDERC